MRSMAIASFCATVWFQFYATVSRAVKLPRGIIIKTRCRMFYNLPHGGRGEGGDPGQRAFIPLSGHHGRPLLEALGTNGAYLVTNDFLERYFAISSKTTCRVLRSSNGILTPMSGDYVPVRFTFPRDKVQKPTHTHTHTRSVGSDPVSTNFLSPKPFRELSIVSFHLCFFFLFFFSLRRVPLSSPHSA